MDQEKLLFQNITTEYFEYEKTIKRMKISSIHTYEKQIRYNLNEFFIDKYIDKISKEEVAVWVDTMNKSNYHIQTKNHILHNFKKIYEFAKYKYDVINLNIEKIVPFNEDPNIVKDSESKKKSIWTMKEVNIFFDACDKKEKEETEYINKRNKEIEEINKVRKKKMEKTGKKIELLNPLVNNHTPLRIKILCSLIVYAGLRPGEAAALKISDLKYDEENSPYLSINKTLVEVPGNNKHYLASPKSECSVREVPIVDKLQIILKEVINMIKINEKEPLDDYYFTSLKKTPTTINSCKLPKRKIEESAKLKHNRFHDLRALFITLLINAKEPIEAISKLVGHSSPEITYRNYYYLFPKNAKKTIQKLNKIF